MRRDDRPCRPLPQARSTGQGHSKGTVRGEGPPRQRATESRSGFRVGARRPHRQPAERADADVGPVGNQAESREKLSQVGQRHPAQGEDNQQSHRQKDTRDWPRPNDNHRGRGGRHVGSGDRQRVQDDPLDRPARGFRPKDMPKFVDGHHRQPAQRQEGADQKGLVKAFHIHPNVFLLFEFFQPLDRLFRVKRRRAIGVSHELCRARVPHCRPFQIAK